MEVAESGGKKSEEANGPLEKERLSMRWTLLLLSIASVHMDVSWRVLPWRWCPPSRWPRRCRSGPTPRGWVRDLWDQITKTTVLKSLPLPIAQYGVRIVRRLLCGGAVPVSIETIANEPNRIDWSRNAVLRVTILFPKKKFKTWNDHDRHPGDKRGLFQQQMDLVIHVASFFHTTF